MALSGMEAPDLPVEPRLANDAPRVAVIVPAYGVAHLLPGALDSLLAQDFVDWEAIVIDDGAPDDVAGAVAPYLDDARIRFLQTGNGGISAARNRAIAATSAPLVALLDGDDRFRPTYLSKMVAALDADPHAIFATCDALIFGSGPAVGQRVSAQFPRHSRGELANVMNRSFNVYIGTTFRRAAFDRVGGFDENMRMAEDLDLWFRFLAKGGHALYIDDVLGEYCSRQNSASTDYRAMLAGQLRVYTKMEALLGDLPEADIARKAMARLKARIAKEDGIAKILAGDIGRGLRQLDASHPYAQSPGWRVARALWSVMPFLARPMLSYRQRQYRAIRD